MHSTKEKDAGVVMKEALVIGSLDSIQMLFPCTARRPTRGHVPSAGKGSAVVEAVTVIHHLLLTLVSAVPAGRRY